MPMSASHRWRKRVPRRAAARAVCWRACCLGPLVLLSLGISGSWISGLSALEPLRPLFIGISLLFLFLAYRRLYRAPACAPDAPACSSDLRRQRRLFWLASIVIALLIAFPWYGPLILE